MGGIVPFVWVTSGVEMHVFVSARVRVWQGLSYPLGVGWNMSP